jgi:large subunit ribosomal protein L6
VNYYAKFGNRDGKVDMSRIGRLPIPIPDKVKVQFVGKSVDVTGPHGTLHLDLPQGITAESDGKEITLKRNSEDQQSKSLHGLGRSLLNNMVIGVTDGYRKSLDIIGTGYRATLEGKILTVVVGYSNPVLFPIPEGIKVELETTTDKMTRVKLFSTDKQLVGEVAAKIRRIRLPEPYKGKGIRYTDEHIRRKVGKTTA